MQDVPVNYIAVLVCAVASMVLGFLWYGPVFGKTWMRLMGWDPNHPPHQKDGQNKANQGYAIAFIGALVTAYVLSHLIVFAGSYMNESGMSVGFSTAFWVWLGFVAPISLSSVLWEGKSWKLWCFNNTYHLVQLLMFGAILTKWM